MGWVRCTLLIACFVALGIGSAARAAQEATPIPTPAQEGVTHEPLTSQAVSQLKGAAGPLQIERVRIPAGGEVVFSPDDVTVLVLVVEAGRLDVTSPSAATIQRAAAKLDGAGKAETLASNTPITLQSGDSLVSLSPAGTHLRNTGAETMSFLSVGFGGAASAAAPANAPQAAEEHGLVMALALVVPPPCPPGTEPGSPSLAATPGAGGGGGGAGGVAVAFAAAPACIDVDATPIP